MNYELWDKAHCIIVKKNHKSKHTEAVPNNYDLVTEGQIKGVSWSFVIIMDAFVAYFSIKGVAILMNTTAYCNVLWRTNKILS